MDKEKIIKRIEELRTEIRRAAELYYEKDAPEISDFEYDAMFAELKSLEHDHPELDSEDSPTHRVGGKASEKFAKVTHPVKMGSLSDVFSEDEMMTFLERTTETLLENGVKREDIVYSVEPKIDGLSVSLTYENGILTLGATRGDGTVGENVTENIMTIDGIPHVLPEPLNLTVRGEVYMPRKIFAELNAVKEENGEKLLANPRNAAAGSLRRLDASETAAAHLDIFVFNYQTGSLYGDGHEPSTHGETIERIGGLGFHCINIRTLTSSHEEVISAVRAIGESRDSLPYDIDGAVVKLNSLEQRRIVGENPSTPKWAAAFKYPPERKNTKLISIEVQVGRTGAVTPLAVLESVRLAGTNVSRATLHNIDIIRELDIRVGDIVTVQKAGDIIPEILCSVKEKRTGEEVPFEFPEFCPSCGEKLVWDNADAEDETADDTGILRCMNPVCPAQLLRKIEYFASRKAMNIEGLGSELVKSLVDAGMVNSVADLYRLNRKEVMALPRMGAKSTDKLLAAVEASKTRGAARLLYALGIRHVGDATAEALMKRFRSISALASADKEQIAEVDDIGEVTADTIKKFFDMPDTQALITSLEFVGLTTELPEATEEEIENSKKLAGLIFVLTGTLPTLKRDEATALIKNAGGKVSGSVSKKTSYVVVGEDAGSKLTDAKKLGTPLLTEEELLEMLK